MKSKKIVAMLVILTGTLITSPLWYPAARDHITANQSMVGLAGIVEADFPGQWTWGPLGPNDQLQPGARLGSCKCGLWQGDLLTAIAQDRKYVVVEWNEDVPNPEFTPLTYFTILPRLQFARMVRAARDRPHPPQRQDDEDDANKVLWQQEKKRVANMEIRLKALLGI